jgi:hypothetical protein
VDGGCVTVRLLTVIDGRWGWVGLVVFALLAACLEGLDCNVTRMIPVFVLMDDAPASFDECRPPPASERGSSSGLGSPRAEHEVLAGSPHGAIVIDHEAARSWCEPIRRLEAVKRRCDLLRPCAVAAMPRTHLGSTRQAEAESVSWTTPTEGESP